MGKNNSERNITDNINGILPTGTKLGKYQIVERLGTGGEAIVYKGYDAGLDRYVAIKQVAPQMAADERFRQRFRDIVRQLAKLDCEQIVTIYELIEQNGGLFVVMEFVEGHTIERALADQPEQGIEPKVSLQIIWRIAAGLSVLHRAGIVHRDLKPGNIIVGEGLKVKITDFGVAARIGTAVSMRLGTTKYMAPELFTGGEVDGRADIYSLGMIAYEMLLGREKFNEVFHEIVRDPHSEALRWMKWHSSPDQVAPALSEVNPEIPQALSVIVSKMLAKDPEERFSSVEELGREIKANFSPRAQRPARRARKDRVVRRATGAQATTAETTIAAEESEELTIPSQAPAEAGPATAEIPKEPMSLRKKLTIVAAVIGLFVVGLLAYTIVQQARDKAIRQKAQVEYVRARDLYDKAAKAISTVEKKKYYSQALEGFRSVIKKYNHNDIARKALVRGYLCRAYLGVLNQDWKATHEFEEKAWNELKDLERQQSSRSQLYKWTTRVKKELREFGDYRDNQRQYFSAIKLSRSAIASGELDSAERILGKAKQYALLTEQTEQIKAIQREIDEKRKVNEYWTHIHTGEALAKSGNVKGALAAWDKAISVLELSKDMLVPKVYEDLKKTAESKKNALKKQQQFSDAIAQAQKAQKAGNLLAAAAAYERAGKIGSKPDLTKRAQRLRHDYYLNLGNKDLSAGKLSEAEKAFKKAQSYIDSPAVKAALAKVNQTKTYRGLLAEGNKLFNQKKYPEALEKYQSAKRISFTSEVRDKIRDCRYAIEIAKAEEYRRKEQWDQAAAAYNRARQIKPSAAAEVIARLEMLQRDRSYAEHIVKAEQARKKGDWDEALLQARQAKRAHSTPEVDKLIARIRYDQQIALGKDALDNGDYNGAVAYFKQAKRFLNTPEINKLIEKAEKLKAASGGS